MLQHPAQGVGLPKPVKGSPGQACSSVLPKALPNSPKMLLSLLVLCVTSLTLPLAHGDEGGSPDGQPPRPGNMLGARTPLSTSHPEVKRVTQYAVETFNKGSNSVYYFRDTRVIKAERQLVSGIKYYLTVEMGSTECRKGSPALDRVSVAGCPFSTEEEKLQCQFEVLVVPWTNQTSVQNISCSPI
ncbi:cystatin-M [Phascolarctos cinereus]|uniref:Cystatin-M n=1 Tax=Phascolarctos cinereus TaxID=38626 RepID=A0A6P5IPJ9_PHACI|nr:cystatin-M [Phascolarctos cinereus]